MNRVKVNPFFPNLIASAAAAAPPRLLNSVQDNSQINLSDCLLGMSSLSLSLKNLIRAYKKH